MRKTLFVVMVVTLAVLAGCTAAGSGSSSDSSYYPDTDSGVAPLASIQLAGADGYLKVWNSPAKINAVSGDTIEEVAWVDELGTEVSVPVTETKLLGDDYMAIKYTYDSETTTAVASIDNGDLIEIPTPSDWDEVKYKDDTMIYVSGGAVLQVDPADGSPVKLSDDGTVPSGYLVLSENNTPFVLTNGSKVSYPGGEERALDGSPAVERLYQGLSGAESGGLRTHSLVYDEDSKTYYMIHWKGRSYWEEMIRDDGGVMEGTSSPIAHPFELGAKRIGYGAATPENSVFIDYDSVAKIEISGGEITLTECYTYANTGWSYLESKYVDGLYYYQSNEVESSTYQIRESNLVDEDRVLIEVGLYDLESWDVVAGQLFWIDDNGSWVMDLDTGETEAFKASAIEAVAE